VKTVNSFFFLSLLFTALAMPASFAYLYELPNKMRLSAQDYLTVQQIYRGWALLGIVVLGALISTLVLTILVRRAARSAFKLVLTAFLCIVATQIVFWVFTYPVNQITQNWTVLPDNWMQLRTKWEYSHATGAAFNLAAFITLVLATRTTA
jgi:hypothetical protein